MNRAATRRDLPYLRRRVKPAAAPPAVASPPAVAAPGATPAAAPGGGYSGGHPIVPRARGARPGASPVEAETAPAATPDGGYRGGHPIVPRAPGTSRSGEPGPVQPNPPGAPGGGSSRGSGSGLDLGPRTASGSGSGGSGSGGSGSGGSGSGGSSGLDLGPRGGGGTGLDLGARTPSAAEAAGTRPGEPRSSGTPGGSTQNERRARPDRPTRPGPFPAPTVDDVRELGADEPVLRLNPRESAVGSLIISGTSSVAWETTDLITGAATPDGGSEGTPVSTPGNRALVGYDGPDVIVSLRHLHRLRRALFIGTSSGPIGVQLFDGSSFTVSTPDRSPLFALSLLRVGSLIELRAEPVTREASAAQLHREFGFSMTPHLTAREPRRR